MNASMKKILKAVAWVVGGLLLLGAAAVAWFALRWPPRYPDTPRPAITASRDPDVIARGRYLFHSVAHCDACHSSFEEYLGLAPGQLAVPKGGHEWHMGPLGTLRSANITPHEATGIGRRSDADLARAIRYGVMPDDRAAMFMMAVGPMSDEDLTAVISFVRTLEPVDNAVAPHEIGVFGKVLFSTAASMFASPKPDLAAPPFVREGGASEARGKYLAEGPAMCFGCHSQYDGEFHGPLLCGNPSPFPDEHAPDFEYAAPNLTPGAKDGPLEGMSEDEFLRRFRAPRVYRTSPMPWEGYRDMTDDDLRSIHRYLKTLAPCERTIGPSYRKTGSFPG
jgi:mono/diheme cytochrome c family protein